MAPRKRSVRRPRPKNTKKAKPIKPESEWDWRDQLRYDELFNRA